MRADSLNLGGTILGNPACAKAPSLSAELVVDTPFLAGQLGCAVRGVGNRPFGILFDVGEYSGEGYQELRRTVDGAGNPALKNPSCASSEGSADSIGHIDFICALTDRNNAVWGTAVDAHNNEIFTDEAVVYLLPAQFVGDVSCASSGSEAAICAGVTTAGTLVAVRFSPRTTQSNNCCTKPGPAYPAGVVQDLGGQLVGNPSCAPARGGFNEVTCAARDFNNALVGIRFNPSSGYSSGFRNLGGTIVGDPSCANSGAGVVTCAAKNTNNALVGIRFDPRSGGSSGYQLLGGTFAGNPSCASALGGLNRVICAARAPDSTLQGVRFNPSTGYSSGFQGLGGDFIGDPSCANSDDGIVTCGVRNIKSELIAIEVDP